MAQAGTVRIPGADITNALSTGQVATHCMQPVHSAERMVTN